MNRAVKLLLIEDNPGDVDLFRETLGSSAAVTVDVATDGDQALAKLGHPAGGAARERPDLIVLDWDLPRKAGNEVLAEIKSDPGLRHIPVIVMTSSQSPRDIQQIYTLGASSCVVKPLELERLSRVMRVMEAYWLVAVTYCEEVGDVR